MLRYRYPGEDYQRINGDDYLIEVNQVLTQNTSYQAVYRQAIIRNNAFQGWGDETIGNIGTYNGISNWRTRVVWRGVTYYQDAFSPWLEKSTPTISERQASFTLEITNSQGVTVDRLISGGSFGLWFLRLQQTNEALRSTNYTFKVFSNGQIVYEETRDVAPEVEDIPDDECPPDTCEVSCGDTICCYNSQGISVHSFPAF